MKPSVVADVTALEISYLRHRSFVNLLLGLGAVAFSAISVVLFILNTFDAVCRSGRSCVQPTDRRTFHLLEFWSAFLFNVLNVFVMVFSEKDVSQQFRYPALFKIIVLLNVGASLICAVLVTLNTELFEFPAHQIEYTNELTMAGIDIALVLAVLRQREMQDSFITRAGAVVCGVVGLGVAITQLALYNGMGFNEQGEPKGEIAAHYFEYTFDFIMGNLTAWFAFETKLTLDTKVKELLNPPEEVKEEDTFNSVVAVDQVDVQLPDDQSERSPSQRKPRDLFRSCFSSM